MFEQYKKNFQLGLQMERYVKGTGHFFDTSSAEIQYLQPKISYCFSQRIKLPHFLLASKPLGSNSEPCFPCWGEKTNKHINCKILIVAIIDTLKHGFQS